jgi:hypothetical protein
MAANSHLHFIATLAFASLRDAKIGQDLWRIIRPTKVENDMNKRTMMILASAVLAGSLLAAGAQARGGGGGGGGHGGGGIGMGGFGGGHIGGFGGARIGGLGGARIGGLGGTRIGGVGVAHVDNFGARSMAANHDHFGLGRRRFVGVYGYCPDYPLNTPPYTCTY